MGRLLKIIPAILATVTFLASCESSNNMDASLSDSSLVTLTATIDSSIADIITRTDLITRTDITSPVGFPIPTATGDGYENALGLTISEAGSSLKSTVRQNKKFGLRKTSREKMKSAASVDDAVFLVAAVADRESASSVNANEIVAWTLIDLADEDAGLTLDVPIDLELQLLIVAPNFDFTDAENATEKKSHTKTPKTEESETEYLSDENAEIFSGDSFTVTSETEVDLGELSVSDDGTVTASAETSEFETLYEAAKVSDTSDPILVVNFPVVDSSYIEDDAFPGNYIDHGSANDEEVYIYETDGNRWSSGEISETDFRQDFPLTSDGTKQTCSCDGLVSFQTNNFLGDASNDLNHLELTISFQINISSGTEMDDFTAYFLSTGEFSDLGWFGFNIERIEGEEGRYVLGMNILGKDILPIDPAPQIAADTWTLVAVSLWFADGSSGETEAVSRSTVKSESGESTRYGSTDGSDGTLNSDSFDTDTWGLHGFLTVCGVVPMVTSLDLGDESIQPTANYQDGIGLADIILWDSLVDTDTIQDNARDFQ